uniref:Uncharacterized protein n=1 Tax=Zea mays TaxID=4577 RepID=C0PNW9_MAIZE|nr:unknown [Zea mays]
MRSAGRTKLDGGAKQRCRGLEPRLADLFASAAAICNLLGEMWQSAWREPAGAVAEPGYFIDCRAATALLAGCWSRVAPGPMRLLVALLACPAACAAPACCTACLPGPLRLLARPPACGPCAGRSDGRLPLLGASAPGPREKPAATTQ